MLWEVQIRPLEGQPDREAARVLNECRLLGLGSVREVRSARSFLIQGELEKRDIERAAAELLVDPVIETYTASRIDGASASTDADAADGGVVLHVLYKPGVTDPVAESTQAALHDLGIPAQAVATARRYVLSREVLRAELDRLKSRVLANDAIERVIEGPLRMESIALGGSYEFRLLTVPLRDMDDAALMRLSREGQLFLELEEMQALRAWYQQQGRDPTDVELETFAQTWSEHCSHKTLTGPVHYVEADGTERTFNNLLKETIFQATQTIRRRLGERDWCVSVFEDNAGIVRFNERWNVCFKVETHNHPSALEPYGGANTGLGGVIRDPLGTGLGARPVCNTDVFCFAPPETPYERLPPGVLHPRAVAQGVVAGVRDYGNRMGIPTVNGAVLFDDRYLGNPLVYCGNVAIIPTDKCRKRMQPGDWVVVVGGRTGRDGIHGATFSSAELTHESEELSGGAVQIGNAITEKMMLDVILEARDRGLYSAITDCGAGGFSSAVGEMAAETGAEVWLERAPLKYAGLSYTEIWISEAQERMVLAVPPPCWDELHALCASEGVEATIIGRFTDSGRLVLRYQGHQVADLPVEFLHKGRPRIVREARWEPPSPPERPAKTAKKRFDDDLLAILGSLNVCSKEWVIRQYDHEVQGGSVVKPLTGICGDGPSDAAVVRPDLESQHGLVIGCGINPRYGDRDPYRMAAGAIDEAVRNCVAVGADPARIAILDNFCWGNTQDPETLGSLVQAALGCHDVAVAYGTPFISGKDSLNNEFTYVDAAGQRHTVRIPPTLLISALGHMDDVRLAVTMDLKQPGNRLFLVGRTGDEMGGSHYGLVNGGDWGEVPGVDTESAPRIFRAVHESIQQGLVRSCHDLSEGGLAVALAEMAFAGGLGAEVALAPIAEAAGLDDEAVLLFSESHTRFLLEVSPDDVARLVELFADLPLAPIGEVTDGGRVQILGVDERPVIDIHQSELKARWKGRLAW